MDAVETTPLMTPLSASGLQFSPPFALGVTGQNSKSGAYGGIRCQSLFLQEPPSFLRAPPSPDFEKYVSYLLLHSKLSPEVSCLK